MKLFCLLILFFFLNLSLAAPQCSGNGRAFSDTGYLCECYQCFEGKSCENKIPLNHCNITAVGGNPLLYNEYWETTPLKGDVTLLTDYRTGYQFDGLFQPGHAAVGIGNFLRSAIVNLHKQVGNVDVTNKNIVIGTGCTNLIAAASWALATKRGKPTTIFAEAPYYDGYKAWADINPNMTPFNSSLHLLDPSSIVEFNTYPNNPNGEHRKPYYKNTFATVWDLVYYWPSLTDIDQKLDGDIMLFSLSKLSGHAGSRFGWAFVKDLETAELMEKFIRAAQIQTSIDTQYRAMNIINHITESDGGFFNFIKGKMQNRWDRLSSLLKGSTKIQNLSVPGQFYAWLKCTENINCFDFLKSAGITGWAGPTFGATNQYVRLELVEHDQVFDFILEKLKTIV